MGRRRGEGGEGGEGGRSGTRGGYPPRESSGPRKRRRSQVNSTTAASFIPET